MRHNTSLVTAGFFASCTLACVSKNRVENSSKHVKMTKNSENTVNTEVGRNVQKWAEIGTKRTQLKPLRHSFQRFTPRGNIAAILSLPMSKSSLVVLSNQQVMEGLGHNPWHSCTTYIASASYFVNAVQPLYLPPCSTTHTTYNKFGFFENHTKT